MIVVLKTKFRIVMAEANEIRTVDSPSPPFEVSGPAGQALQYAPPTAPGTSKRARQRERRRMNGNVRSRSLDPLSPPFQPNQTYRYNPFLAAAMTRPVPNMPVPPPPAKADFGFFRDLAQRFGPWITNNPVEFALMVFGFATLWTGPKSANFSAYLWVVCHLVNLCFGDSLLWMLIADVVQPFSFYNVCVFFLLACIIRCVRNWYKVQTFQALWLNLGYIVCMYIFYLACVFSDARGNDLTLVIPWTLIFLFLETNNNSRRTTYAGFILFYLLFFLSFQPSYPLGNGGFHKGGKVYSSYDSEGKAWSNICRCIACNSSVPTPNRVEDMFETKGWDKVVSLKYNSASDSDSFETEVFGNFVCPSKPERDSLKLGDVNGDVGDNLQFKDTKRFRNRRSTTPPSPQTSQSRSHRLRRPDDGVQSTSDTPRSSVGTASSSPPLDNTVTRTSGIKAYVENAKAKLSTTNGPEN